MTISISSDLLEREGWFVLGNIFPVGLWHANEPNLYCICSISIILNIKYSIMQYQILGTEDVVHLQYSRSGTVSVENL